MLDLHLELIVLSPAVKSHISKNKTYPQTSKSSLSFYRPHQFLKINLLLEVEGKFNEGTNYI